jgi:DNA-binding GntR family transcriptional regulator
MPPQPLLPSPSADGSANRTNRAYEAIRGAIHDNHHRPGSLLSENRLAQSLGMSRTPIREALKKLENEGLVEIVNVKGMLAGIRMKIRRYQLDSARALNDVQSVVAQHLEILALLKRREPEALAGLLKRHIRQAAANLVQDPVPPA